MAYYPPEVIEEVRMGNDIVDVVSSYVQLKQKGNYYFGLCPFHNEKSPSFSVSPDKQIYHCFGCGASGNVYSFIMQIENYDFVDAIKHLAGNIRYTLPDGNNESREKARLRESLFEINKAAARYFYENLETTEGKRAVSYMNGRNISSRARIKYGLGYSDTKRGALFTYLQERGWDIDTILQSGLVAENKDKKGGYHDRFWGRLMFPIFDATGRIVGFGGRILGDGEPKYLNSPETPLFDKSRNLYGINYARLSKTKEFILVEGYMDVISLYQSGFTNTVAALGTAFNDEHARLLKKYADSVVILFDSDAPGVKAALKAIPVLTANGLRVKVLQIVDAKDPDEYLQKHGREAFAKLLKTAVSHIIFQTREIQKKYNLSNTDEKVLFTLEVSKLLAELSNPVEQDAYIREISKLTNLSEEAIRSQVKADPAAKRFMPDTKKTFPYARGRIGASNERGLLQAKKSLLYHAANHRYVAQKLRDYLDPEELDQPVYTELLKFIYSMHDKNQAFCPAESISHFETLEEQKEVGAVFNEQERFLEDERDENYDKKLEKTINESLRLVKRNFIDKQMDPGKDINLLQKLAESKRNVEKLYITFSGG